MERVMWVAVLMLAITVPVQANIVYNGDFNTGDLDGWWSWSPEDPDQSITIEDSEYGYDGTPYVVLWSASDGAWQELGTNAFGCAESTTYTLSFVYKADAWAGGGINLKYWDSAWAEVGSGEWIPLLSGEGSGEWTSFSYDFTTAAGAANMEVKFAMGSWGTLSLDYVSVVPEPATVSLLTLGCLGLLKRRSR